MRYLDEIQKFSLCYPADGSDFIAFVVYTLSMIYPLPLPSHLTPPPFACHLPVDNGSGPYTSGEGGRIGGGYKHQVLREQSKWTVQGVRETKQGDGWLSCYRLNHFGLRIRRTSSCMFMTNTPRTLCRYALIELTNEFLATSAAEKFQEL